MFFKIFCFLFGHDVWLKVKSENMYGQKKYVRECSRCGEEGDEW